MEQNYAEELGLSTSEALNKLYVEIESVLLQFKYSQKSRKSKNLAWIRDALSLKSKNTTIDWIAAGFQLWTSLALVLGYCLDGDNSFTIINYDTMRYQIELKWCWIS